MKLKPIYDDKFFDYRLRKKEHKKYKLRIYYGGRNLGKTTRTFLTEIQEQYSQYKNGVTPKVIGSLVRTEKLWQKIKQGYLNNLTEPPFNLPLMVEGKSVWWVQKYEKTDKDGVKVTKYKRLFKAIDIFFLWSANEYKLGNWEHIKCLIFDEIIPEHDGYIPKEIAKFDTMLSTFSRLRDDFYIIGICNDVTDNSPYFEYVGITPDNFPQPSECWVNPHKSYLFEYCKTSEKLQKEIDKSSAGILQRDRAYGKMASGRGKLKSENYLLLASPRGELKALYNVFIDNESYIVHKYVMHELWIEKGNNPYIPTYYLDSQSAIRQKKPYSYSNNDWFANTLNIKLDKGYCWFKEFEIREIFVDWLTKNF